MRIKSYFANSVPEAIEKARLELGSNAMLMNSKKTEIELQVLGAYEVVFGVPSEAVPAGQKNETSASTTRASLPAASSSVSVPASPAADVVHAADVVKELADLRRQIETVRRSVNRQSRVQPERTGPIATHVDSINEIEECLLGAEFSEELAHEIAEAVGAAVETKLASSRHETPVHGLGFDVSAPELFQSVLLAELERRFSVAPELGTPGQLRRVLFAGPPGAGKTTTLIKLALRYGLQARVPVQILSLDTLRVGGWEQLSSYARIAGLPFDAIHTLSALGQALREHRGKELILIDTPGFSPSDLHERSELAVLLERESDIEVQLVLSAVLRPKLALRVVERFASFRPAKLLLTHLDEVEGAGEVLEVAMRAKLPLSYLASGQQIPEDIHEACKERLLASFGESSRRLVASAA